MIKCNLSTYMGAKKLDIQAVHNETGLARNTISGLYKETVKRIDYNTLEILCRYFNCTIGEMLVIVDDVEKSKS